jgi:hypothetical protein
MMERASAAVAAQLYQAVTLVRHHRLFRHMIRM